MVCEFIVIIHCTELCAMSIIKSLKGYLLARLNGMLKLFHEIKYSTEFKNYNTKLAAFKKKAAALNKGLCNALNFFIAQMECGAQNFYIVGIANDVFVVYIPRPLSILQLVQKLCGKNP